MTRVIEIDDTVRAFVDTAIEAEWSGPMIVSRGKLIDTSKNPGFACVEAGKISGFATFLIHGDECEITTLAALEAGKGIGSALIDRVVREAKLAGCRRVFLITTNDNTHVIRFYQRRGFDLAAVRLNALEEARKLKPSIPMVGMDGIPIQHEFEFEKIL